MRFPNRSRGARSAVNPCAEGDTGFDTQPEGFTRGHTKHMMPQMKRCPDCQAPNPSVRTRCFSCAQSLDRRRLGEPAPGERAFNCANCGTKVAYGAETCPGCGRVLRAAPAAGTTVRPLPTSATALPAGWEVHPLPDGSLRLFCPVQGACGLRDITLPIALVLGLFFLLRSFLINGGRVTNIWGDTLSRPWMMYAPAALLVIVGLVGCLWVTVARTEIHVGHGWLEVHRRLLGMGTSRRIEGASATLRVLTSRVSGSGEHRPRTRRILSVEGKGQQRAPLYEKISDSELLAAVLSSARDEVGTVADFLSARTGWPVADPAGSGRV